MCAFVFTVLYVVMMDTQCAMGVSRQNYKYKYTHTHALNPAVGHFNISFG